MTDHRSQVGQPPVDDDPDGQGHVQPTQTRGASKEGVVRWVLIASMILIVGAMALVFLWGGS